MFGTSATKTFSRSKPGFVAKVKELVTKVDNDGKLITALLVGVGVILVVLQTIK